jgi:DNA-binding CsgD family transcriptional regulator
MGTFGARVDAAARLSFLGRRRELSRLVHLMRQTERLPGVVHLHGPAGIGKSTLLRMWRAECERQGLSDVAIVDSQEFAHTLVSLTDILEQRLGTWPPVGPAPIGIAIDGFDQLADMGWRFREDFLRDLAGPVLVVLAGRGGGPLAEPASGWDAVVEDLPLEEFTAAESRIYLAAGGVGDSRAVDAIIHLSGGNPLALALAADQWSTAVPGVGGLVAGAPTSATHALLGRLTSEIQGEEEGRLLEAAAVVRTFDQELLAALAGEVGDAAFDRFRQLSFVRSAGAGFRVHDLVRAMVIADLQRRRPEAHQRLRRRAHAHLIRRAAGSSASSIPYEVLLELMFLSEEAMIRAAFFDSPGEDLPDLRLAQPHEHGRVRELAANWAAGQPGIEPASLRSHVDLLLRLTPVRFLFVLDQAGRPVGFCGTVALNRTTVPSLRQPWAFHFEAVDQRELWAYRSAPEGDCSAALVVAFVVPAPGRPEAHAALLRATILRGALQTRRLVALTPYAGDQQLFERLHFRALGADASHQALVLDLSERGVEGWVERLLGVESPETAGGRRSGAPLDPAGQPTPATALHEKLSPRECELLAAVAAGLGNKQIAHRLSISQNTVRNHLASVYRKLDVPDRTHAILYAIRERLVEVS